MFRDPVVRPSKYEQAMFPRSRRRGPDLHEILGADTPHNLIDKFARQE